eukprot:7249906-Prymnesium_polylepis.2
MQPRISSPTPNLGTACSAAPRPAGVMGVLSMHIVDRWTCSAPPAAWMLSCTRVASDSSLNQWQIAARKIRSFGACFPITARHLASSPLQRLTSRSSSEHVCSTRVRPAVVIADMAMSWSSLR